LLMEVRDRPMRLFPTARQAAAGPAPASILLGNKGSDDGD
jgi:hypothetical protein